MLFVSSYVLAHLSVSKCVCVSVHVRLTYIVCHCCEMILLPWLAAVAFI